MIEAFYEVSISAMIFPKEIVLMAFRYLPQEIHASIIHNSYQEIRVRLDFVDRCIALNEKELERLLYNALICTSVQQRCFHKNSNIRSIFAQTAFFVSREAQGLLAQQRSVVSASNLKPRGFVTLVARNEYSLPDILSVAQKMSAYCQCIVHANPEYGSRVLLELQLRQGADIEESWLSRELAKRLHHIKTKWAILKLMDSGQKTQDPSSDGYAMITFDIKTGWACNNDCIHCIIAPHRLKCVRQGIKIDKTTTEYKNDIRMAKEAGGKHIVVTGGEPTIRADIIELLRYARDLGLSITMQTNGRRFHSKKFAEQLMADFPEMRYVIALHGACPETHDKISRRPGSFAQTVTGLNNLKKVSQHISGMIVLSKINFREIVEILRLFRKLGVGQVMVAFPHAKDMSQEYIRSFVPKYTDIIGYVRTAIEEESRKIRVHLELETIPFCFLVGFEEYANNLSHLVDREKSRKIISGGPGTPSKWYNWDCFRPRIRIKFRQCAKCAYDFICEGPWKEYSSIYGSDEFVPVNQDSLKALLDRL